MNSGYIIEVYAREHPEKSPYDEEYESDRKYSDDLQYRVPSIEEMVPENRICYDDGIEPHENTRIGIYIDSEKRKIERVPSYSSSSYSRCKEEDTLREFLIE